MAAEYKPIQRKGRFKDCPAATLMADLPGQGEHAGCRFAAEETERRGYRTGIFLPVRARKNLDGVTTREGPQGGWLERRNFADRVQAPRRERGRSFAPENQCASAHICR